MTNAPEPDIRELLASTSTPTLTHLLGERGYRNVFLGGLHPLGNAQRAIGRARTLRYTPHRPDLMPADLACNPQRLAIESIEPGEVLVVETGGELGAGVLGDILLSRVVKRGGAAFVVDGAVRDAGEIRQFKIPVFVRGVHGAAHWRELVPVEHDGPIRCAGCTVTTGDWIVCDEHGVACGAHEPCVRSCRGRRRERSQGRIRARIDRRRGLDDQRLSARRSHAARFSCMEGRARPSVNCPRLGDTQP